MRANGRWLSGLLLLSGMALAQPATQKTSTQKASTTPPPEATSDLADLRRERDAFYLKLDGRLPKEPGIAPPGTREMAIRLDSATRGRDFPGRYTVIEVELMPSANETVEVGFLKGPAVKGTLPAGKWSKVRLPVPTDRADLLVRSPNGLSNKMEFRRVRLIDDRWTIWDEGWKVERVAGVLTITRPGQPDIALPASTESWQVSEADAIRVRLAKGSTAATVYATGRVASTSPELPPAGGDSRLKVTIGEDFGRVDRGTEGDADGDGYNEALGAMMVRLSDRRSSFSVSSPNGERVHRPALELLGLPEGAVTVLWEGKLVKTALRLTDGAVLVELPGDVRDEGRVEVSVTGTGAATANESRDSR